MRIREQRLYPAITRFRTLIFPYSAAFPENFLQKDDSREFCGESLPVERRTRPISAFGPESTGRILRLSLIRSLMARPVILCSSRSSPASTKQQSFAPEV